MPIQAPAAQPAYQVTEYVQDIYPPAQVFTEQVPVVNRRRKILLSPDRSIFVFQGYVAQNNVQESSPIVRQQTTLNCQPGVVIPTGSSSALQQRLSTGQVIQRPLSVGGSAGVQTVMLPSPVQTRIIR